MRYSLNTITRRASMGIAVLAAGVCVAAPAAQAETSGQAVAGSTVHIDTCRVAKSYHQDFTYAYCANRSATAAFCSASRMATFASRFKRLTISKISATSMGASPIEGSSSSISLGWAMSARPMAPGRARP